MYALAMTKLIDGDRLRAWLVDQDGLDAMLIQLVLNDFEYQPPQTPMDEIKPNVRNLVRRHDPHTSWEAAWGAVTSENRQMLYRIIHFQLSKNSMTDEELSRLLREHAFKHSPSGLRTRRSELVDAGWVRDSGVKRPSPTGGRQMIVWEAVPEAVS